MLRSALLLGLVCTATAMQIRFYDNDDSCSTQTSVEVTSDNVFCADTGTTSVQFTCSSALSNATTTVTAFSSADDCTGNSVVYATGDSGDCITGAGGGGASYILTCTVVPGCFSSESTVTLESGEVKPYEALAVGDRVLSIKADGTTFFDKVFRIPHHDAELQMEFVRITTAAGNVLEVSPAHFLHVSELDLSTLRTAGELSLGDTLFVAAAGSTATPTTVVALERVLRTGSFNVHTLSGNIVVDGVVATHFTTSSGWTGERRAYAPAWYRVVDTMNALTGAEDASLP